MSERRGDGIVVLEEILFGIALCHFVSVESDTVPEFDGADAETKRRCRLIVVCMEHWVGIRERFGTEKMMALVIALTEDMFRFLERRSLGKDVGDFLNARYDVLKDDPDYLCLARDQARKTTLRVVPTAEIL